MKNAITPEQVEEAAVKARKPLVQFIREAGINPATFYRWKGPGDYTPRALTLAKLADAVEAVQ